jgi:hypothetical protein
MLKLMEGHLRFEVFFLTSVPIRSETEGFHISLQKRHFITNLIYNIGLLVGNAMNRISPSILFFLV